MKLFSRIQLDHPFSISNHQPNLATNNVRDDRVGLESVHILVKSRLFSHQLVSQGNIYYPIIAKMSMSRMCEPGFT